MNRRDPFILTVIAVYAAAAVLALVTGVNDIWAVTLIGIAVHVIYWRRSGRWI